MTTRDAGQITIRRATLADAAAAAALTDEAYEKYIPLIGRKPQPMTADYAKMVVENTIWLLFAGEVLAGVLVLVDEPEQMLIYSVAVRPGFQHQGFGRRLLEWAERQAKERGYRSIRLYTNGKFEYNLRLYERLGYRETGRETLLNSIVVHMVKVV